MRLVPASAILATALLGSAHAEGDALVDMLGPREIAVGEAMRGEATGMTSVALNPAGVTLNREVVFEGDYGYRAADGASLIGASACDSTATLPGCFYYEYAGSNPDLGGMTLHRSTHIGGLALGYPVTPNLAIGSTLKYFHFDSDVMDEPKASGFTGDIGANFTTDTRQLSVGVAGYNLLGTESVEFRAGVLHDNGLDSTYLSAGLGIATQSYGIDVAGRMSIAGPSDKLIIASMRFYGPRLPAVAAPAE
jgi:hypothetical protein